jgi:hypothetical protein
MAIDTNFQTFTDAEMLAAYRSAMMNGSFRTTYSINGRSITIPDADTCMKVIGWLEARINEANGTGDVALGTFGDPV